MSEQVTFHQEPQEGTTSTVTVLETDERDAEVQEVPTLTLKLRKPKTDRKVQWSNETVDNENMNKKKSKCCCIYDKPKKFGESSSEDESDDECDHCHGHVERKKKTQANPAGESSSTLRSDSSQTVTVDN